MIKTTLKIDGMMCGMCESHIKKVTSSAQKGETVVISEDELDLSLAGKEIKEIGYELKDAKSEPYEKKGLFGLFK